MRGFLDHFALMVMRLWTLVWAEMEKFPISFEILDQLNLSFCICGVYKSGLMTLMIV